MAGLARAVRLSLGETLERLGRPADATGAYREILEDLPDDLVARRSLTRSLAGAGDFTGAQTELNIHTGHCVPSGWSRVLQHAQQFPC